MMENTKYLSIIDKFNQMLNKFNQIEKNPRDYGTGMLLYPSEVHLIESIGKNPGINVTELANIHGISKAAISQKLQKLEEKELIQRFKDNCNEKAVLLKLKIKGEVAFKGHENFHSTMDAVLIRKINDLPSEYMETFERLIDEINTYADSFLLS
jgi:DNA-binding MarR family transcriptional regulator